LLPQGSPQMTQFLVMIITTIDSGSATDGSSKEEGGV
jgi:hypothetical protein